MMKAILNRILITFVLGSFGYVSNAFAANAGDLQVTQRNAGNTAWSLIAVPAAGNVTITDAASLRTVIGAMAAGNVTLAGNGTLTLAGNVTLSSTGNITLGSTTLNIGAGGTLGALAFVTPGTGVAALVTGASSGTGGPAGTTSPTLTTPNFNTASALTGQPMVLNGGAGVGASVNIGAGNNEVAMVSNGASGWTSTNVASFTNLNADQASAIRVRDSVLGERGAWGYYGNGSGATSFFKNKSFIENSFIPVSGATAKPVSWRFINTGDYGSGTTSFYVWGVEPDGQFQMYRQNFGSTTPTVDFNYDGQGHTTIGGSTATTNALHIAGNASISGTFNANAVGDVLTVQNLSTSGASSIGAKSTAGSTLFTMGYGNSAMSQAYLQSRAFLYFATDLSFVNGSAALANMSTTTGALTIGNGNTAASNSTLLDVLGTAVVGTAARVSGATYELNVIGTSGNLLRLIKGGVGKMDVQYNGTSGTRRIDFVDTDNSAVVPLSLPMNGGAGGVSLRGTTTNDNAASLMVGEFVSSAIASGSAVSLTTATAANITSISLTAGDWDVEGNVNFSASTATVTGTSAGISSTSATLPADGTEAYSGVQVTLVSEVDSVTMPRKRISIAGTTTVYLVGKSTFSAGTVTAFGSISARRVR